MLNKSLRSLVTVFALLTFIGQSLAAASISCTMADAEPANIMQSSDMHHADHAMQDSSDTVSLSDCCGEGFCTMNQCLSAPTFFVTSATDLSERSSNILNSHYSFSYLDLEPLSHFRPPISH